MKRLLLSLLLGSMVVAVPDTATAQLVRFGIGAGPSTPAGNFGDVFDTGVHAQAMIGLQVPLLPVRLRADLGYHRFPSSGAESLDQFAGVVNGFLTVVPLPVVNAYVSGGAGLYHASHATESSTDFGVNGGVGVRANLWLIAPFAEVRYHHVLGDGSARFLPVTIGVMF
jgi:hypothetical protein